MSKFCNHPLKIDFVQSYQSFQVSIKYIIVPFRMKDLKLGRRCYKINAITTINKGIYYSYSNILENLKYSLVGTKEHL